MVALRQVELGKPLRASGLVEQRIDVRQGLDEGLSDGIEAPIIVADAPGTIRFASEDDGSGMTRR
jgi:hypothetical protein